MGFDGSGTGRACTAAGEWGYQHVSGLLNMAPETFQSTAGKGHTACSRGKVWQSSSAARFSYSKY